MIKKIQTAFALIKKDGQILMIQEGFKPAYGQWCLPGGHVDSGESLTEAAKREAREETGGLEISVHNLIFSKTMTNAEYNGRPEENDRMMQVNIYLATVTGGMADKNKLTEELNCRWFAPDDVKHLPLRWPWLKDLL